MGSVFVSLEWLSENAGKMPGPNWPPQALDVLRKLSALYDVDVSLPHDSTLLRGEHLARVVEAAGRNWKSARPRH